MIRQSADHTHEVENRLKAIRVLRWDGCAFFCRREGCIMALRHCEYCSYGRFDLEGEDENKPGLCKFK